MVVPQASKPGTAKKLPDPAVAALLVQLPALVVVLSSFTTTELGLTPVKVLLTKSRFTDRFTSPLGVTWQEQQEISCSSGENA